MAPKGRMCLAPGAVMGFSRNLDDKFTLTLPSFVGMLWKGIICVTAQGRGSVHELA